MAKILVAGALGPSEQGTQDFASHLGAEIVKQNHILLTGCLNDFDKAVAKGAFDWSKDKGLDPDKHIRSYVLAGAKPVHQYGAILKSRLSDWGLTHGQLYVPEQIRYADVVILVSGSRGTICAANWARIDEKPILPVTAFGGAAEQTYNEELERFEEKYAGRIDQSQYEVLNRISSDWKKFARDVVSLAEMVISSRSVFAIMSFSGSPQLEDAYESFKEVCAEYQYECNRIDNAIAVNRIIPEIIANIRNSAFVIADLTEETANVYYELGFAQGLNKPAIVTAREGTPLPFDVRDIPTIFWEGQKQLKDLLRKRIRDIASLHGR